MWVDAMVEEYSSIMMNDVWEVVSRPQNILVVGSRWIYKIKYAADGSIEKFKAKFVAGGMHRKKGSTMRKPSPLYPDTLQSDPSSL